MANEFIARKGLISRDNVIITGSLNVSGAFNVNGISTLSVVTASGLLVTGNTVLGDAGTDTLRIYSNDVVLNKGGAGGPHTIRNDNGSSDLILLVSSGNLVLSGSSTSNMSFVDGGTTNMFISASGNVGIGNTTPGAILDIRTGSADANVFTGLTVSMTGVSVNGGSAIFLRNTPNNTDANRFGARVRSVRRAENNGAADIAFDLEKTDASGLEERMRIAGNGNVGIGTTSPLRALDVRTSDAVVAVFSGSGLSTYVDISPLSSDNNLRLGHYSNNIVGLSRGTVVSPHIAISTTGNIGIGTTSPSIRLEVSGSIGAPNFTSGFTGGSWRLDYSPTSSSLEVDNLTVRGTMRVYELLINQIRATNGTLFVSSVGKVETVTGTSPTFFLSFDTGSGGTLGHGFAVGDIIRAQRVNPGNPSSFVYRSDLTVIGVSANGKFVTASVTGSTVPTAGMEFVRLGNIHAASSSRQGTVYLTADDTNAPFIDVIDGVTSHADWNTASGSNRLKTRMGRLNGITGTSFGNLTGYGFYASGSAFLEGGINATTGNIGGFAITKDAITGSGFYISGGAAANGFFISSSGFNVKGNGNITASAGLIAGWSIDSTKLQKGSYLNTDLGTAISIAVTSSGTGFAYNGTYIPDGLTLSWHRPANAGTLIFGQMLATANTPKANYYGIQMMDDSGNEYFALGADVSQSGFRTVYNKIAGWSFDQEKFTGGAATLSSTGNLTLGTGNDVVRISADDGTYRLWAGHATSGSAPFSVTKAGVLNATGAVISGNITATTGNIGGFAITANALTGSGFYISGGAAANGFFISSSGFNVKANGNITASAGLVGGFNITSTEINSGTTLILRGNNGQITGSSVLFTGGRIGGFTLSTNQIASATGTLILKDNGQITGSSVLFTGGVIGGFTLASNQINSSNNALILKDNGQITGSNVLFTGGRIGGFTITNDVLSGTGFLLSGSATGNGFFISSSGFNVKANGNITASAGLVGGWSLSNTELSSGNVSLLATSVSGGLLVTSGSERILTVGNFINVPISTSPGLFATASLFRNTTNGTATIASSSNSLTITRSSSTNPAQYVVTTVTQSLGTISAGRVIALVYTYADLTTYTASAGNVGWNSTSFVTSSRDILLSDEGGEQTGTITVTTGSSTVSGVINGARGFVSFVASSSFNNTIVGGNLGEFSITKGTLFLKDNLGNSLGEFNLNTPTSKNTFATSSISSSVNLSYTSPTSIFYTASYNWRLTAAREGFGNQLIGITSSFGISNLTSTIYILTEFSASISSSGGSQLINTFKNSGSNDFIPYSKTYASSILVPTQLTDAKLIFTVKQLGSGSAYTNLPSYRISDILLSTDLPKVNISRNQAIFYNSPIQYMQWTTSSFDIKGAIDATTLTVRGATNLLGPVTIEGDVTAHPNIQGASSTGNSTGTVIQNLTFDTFGHTTGVSTTNLDSRYQPLGSYVTLGTDQTITSVKTFTPSSNPTLILGSGWPSSFSGSIEFRGTTINGTQASATIRMKNPANSVLIDLPAAGGTMAMLEDITTSQITGTLPVNKGGTGKTSLTNDRVLTGNGTSAIVDEANLTFDGSTLTVTGALTTTGNAKLGDATSDSHTVTGSFGISGSLLLNGSPIGGGGTVTSITAGSGLSGGTITSTGTISLDTGSTHFTNGVKGRLNAEGVISGSSQVAINSTTGTLNVNKGGTGQTSYTNGELLIGNTTGNTLTKATLTQGTGITITNGNGAITITNASPNATHTGDVTGATALTIANNAVTLAKIASIASNTILGNNTGTAINPIALTAAQVRTLINVADGATANTGTVTSVGAGSGLSGGTITSTGTISLDTGSTHFTNGVKGRLNAEGVISGSSQVAINSTTGTLNVNKGGTGQTSLTNNAVLTGNDTNAIVAETFLSFDGGVTNTLSTINLNLSGNAKLGDATADSHTITGSLGISGSLALTTALPVSSGGTGATTFVNNRVLTGNGTGAIVDESNLNFDGTHLSIRTTGTGAVLTIKQDENTDAGGIRLINSADANFWAIFSVPPTSAVHGLNFKYNGGANGGYLAYDANVNNIDFTGQHRSLFGSNPNTSSLSTNELVGFIVISTGTYTNLDGGTEPKINEAIPNVLLSETSYDKRVFGIISDKEDLSDGERKYAVGAWVSTFELSGSSEERLIINSLGEGSMWVCDYSGSLENGDYITTSPIKGLGMRQNDDILHNYTVAKITQDCNFDISGSYVEFEFSGSMYRKQFVGVTYHCG